MDVGCHGPRLGGGAAAHGADVRTTVLAEDRALAGRATEDQLRPAVVPRRLHRLRLASEQLDAVGLDQEVDHKRASGLPLAVEAVAAMDKERLGGQPV